jgi:hypothetical protein
MRGAGGGLDRAVAEIAPFAPQAAAELATGAPVLTLPSDPGRSVRTAAAARALTAAGQWDEAETLVRSARAVPPPARQAAAMRCALASLLALTGRATEAMTEAQTVLTHSGVPGDLRDQATVALMWAWPGLRGNQQADRLAGIILAEPSTKRGELVVAAMVALAAGDRGVPQARHQVARRPGQDRAGASPARGGANPMTGGCEAARVAARLTSC